MLAVYGWIARIAGPVIFVGGGFLFVNAGNVEAHVASTGVVGIGFVVGVVGELLLLHARRKRGTSKA